MGASLVGAPYYGISVITTAIGEGKALIVSDAVRQNRLAPRARAQELWDGQAQMSRFQSIAGDVAKPGRYSRGAR
jgi:hypothetical protein